MVDKKSFRERIVGVDKAIDLRLESLQKKLERVEHLTEEVATVRELRQLNSLRGTLLRRFRIKAEEIINDPKKTRQIFDSLD